MMDLNRAQLIGRLTQDPDLRQTPNGQNVASFSVATNRSWKDASGEQKEQAEFHNIVVWGKLAEIAGNYLKKGRRIYIEGRIQTRSWDDANTGTKKYRTEIVADNFIMLDGKSSDGANSAGSATEESVDTSMEESAPKSSSKKKNASKEEDISIEDVPF